MKKFLHSTLLLGAALICGFGFAACNSDNEPEDPPVVTELDYTPIQAPLLFASPVDIRDISQKELQEMTSARNRGTVVLRTLKEVENYFGSKLEENSPLRTIDYSKKSVITATLFLTAPIVKNTVNWVLQTSKQTQAYIFSCLLNYEKGTEDQNNNIYYNVQPTIVVDALNTGVYVFSNFNAAPTNP